MTPPTPLPRFSEIVRLRTRSERAAALLRYVATVEQLERSKPHLETRTLAKVERLKRSLEAHAGGSSAVTDLPDESA